MKLLKMGKISQVSIFSISAQNKNVLNMDRVQTPRILTNILIKVLIKANIYKIIREDGRKLSGSLDLHMQNSE